MKIFAQQGFAESDKVKLGFDKNFIDGVIYSPRHTKIDVLKERLGAYSAGYPGKELLFDPQFYASLHADEADWRMGYLDEDYEAYFKCHNKSTLERESKVRECLANVIKFQQGQTKLTGIIGPNILISRSFDSREAVISKNFIRNTAEVAADLKEKRPVYATLAVSYQALADRTAFDEFLNEITALETPPDGFYLLISTNGGDAGEFFSSVTIANWMVLNYSLSLNGFKVINGYSDILSPLLLSAGGTAGATGWFANLRNFSLASFEPPKGGRRPLPRYLSNALLNRITAPELDQLRNTVPQILNGLSTDAHYPIADGSIPGETSHEVLQTWESLKNLNGKLSALGMPDRLRALLKMIDNAATVYAKISKTVTQLQYGSEHLAEMAEGIYLFARRSTINLEDVK
ncbi:MAG: hypothetical protein A2020_00880 [Lentisphaerae bacterium GWF2_45_14]|nr:MAG: hypothetical protein A2020_00880 [Lentisphaerae bacterium GWF2_45_14]